MKKICRDCKGIDETTIVLEIKGWKYYNKIGCPIGSLEINKRSYTKIEIIKILEEKCSMEKVISLNEPEVS